METIYDIWTENTRLFIRKEQNILPANIHGLMVNHAYINTYIHTYVHEYIHTHIHIHTYRHAYINIYLDTFFLHVEKIFIEDKKLKNPSEQDMKLKGRKRIKYLWPNKKGYITQHCFLHTCRWTNTQITKRKHSRKTNIQHKVRLWSVEATNYKQL